MNQVLKEFGVVITVLVLVAVLILAALVWDKDEPLPGNTPNPSVAVEKVYDCDPAKEKCV